MIDLSNNNRGPVDFQRAFREGGHRRLYLKATEGLGFTDVTYRERLLQARRAGFRVGPYHFAHSGNDPRAEARKFHAVVGRNWDLRPCLDYETGTPSLRWAVAFNAEARRLFGKTPLLYSYQDFIRRLGASVRIAPLWIAAYGPNDGRDHGVPRAGVHPFEPAAHQFTSRGRVPGIRGLVDVSRVIDASALDV
jgi:lysozyme